jgi:hypothetical protein
MFDIDCVTELKLAQLNDLHSVVSFDARIKGMNSEPNLNLCEAPLHDDTVAASITADITMSEMQHTLYALPLITSEHTTIRLSGFYHCDISLCYAVDWRLIGAYIKSSD